jgi:hypothetical protein
MTQSSRVNSSFWQITWPTKRQVTIGIATLPLLEERGINQPDDMKHGPTMRSYMTHGGFLIDQDTTKCIREILSGEMAIRAATKNEKD